MNAPAAGCTLLGSLRQAQERRAAAYNRLESALCRDDAGYTSVVAEVTEAFAAASGDVRKLIAGVGSESPGVQRVLVSLQEKEREKLRITVMLHNIRRRQLQQKDASAQPCDDFVGSAETVEKNKAAELIRELEACVQAINEAMEELAEEEEMIRERDE